MVSFVKVAALIAMVSIISGCATNATTATRDLISSQVQADQAYERQDCATAAPLYRELADTLKSNSLVLLRLGNCLVRLNRTEEAIAAYREAVQNDPGYIKAWYNLSYIQAQTLSRTVAEMSVNVDPSDPAAERVRVLATEILAAFKKANAVGSPQAKAEEATSEADSEERVAAEEPTYSEEQ